MGESEQQISLLKSANFIQAYSFVRILRHELQLSSKLRVYGKTAAKQKS